MLKKLRIFLIARTSKFLMSLLLRTCRIHVEGVDHFLKIADREKCMLILWHNRLAIIPFILNRYTPNRFYAAVISGSRDGELLNAIVQSFKYGRSIKVPHQARFQALQEMIRNVEEKRHIVVITPDGPRGPKYQVKQGVAIAALETKAYLVTIDWTANRFWEFNTWDRLRLPKPFTTISCKFLPPFRLEDSLSLEEAKTLITQKMPSES